MKPKLMSVVLPAALACLAISARPSQAATLVVDDTLACPGATYTTIQSAVNAAAPGDTVEVCAGTYNESVTITKPLTLNGAQAGIPITLVTGRSFGSPVESKINGQVEIFATNVTFDGFSLTRSVPAFAAFGIVVRPGADGALIRYNIIDTVVSPDTTSNGTAQGIYLENSTSVGPDGADSVSILHNRISNIQSNRSSKGILIGVNNGTDPSQNALITDNVILNITSDTRGAYGISVANTPGVSGLDIMSNTISNLSGGGWAHAIGLEGDTPGVEVKSNSISNVVDLTPATFNDAIAVFFEANPSFSTGQVNYNNFDNVEFGIAVHPALSGPQVNGECNWWGSAFGPGPVGPGFGAKVSPNVDYDPWLTVRGGPCGAPTNTADAKVNGGGTILVPGGKATFSVEAKTKKDGTPQGHLNYQDSATGMVVKSKTITAVTVTGSHATIYGIATINGTGAYGFVVNVDDNGEPGANADIFHIELSSGYARGNTLNSGNIQVH